MKRNPIDNLLNIYMRMIIRRSLIVLAIIIAITLFFAWATTKIELDTNIFAYMSSAPAPDFVLTPDTKPTEVLKLAKTGGLDFIPQRGEVIEVPYRDKSGITEDIDTITTRKYQKPQQMKTLIQMQDSTTAM